MQHTPFIQTKRMDADISPSEDMPDDESIGDVGMSPTTDEVSTLAYDIYLTRGSVHGQDVEHWRDAEAQLLARRSNLQAHRPMTG